MSSSVKAALITNSGIALAKGLGAFFTGSASMLAETIHSIADCGNQLLLMYGMKTSDREADKDHPFGYGKNAYFWSFVVALILFTLGGVYSLYEGFHKALHPEPLQYAGWAFGIILFSFFAELRSFKICIAELREEYPGRTIKWMLKETRRAELLVIFAEDFAALMGLGVAAFGLGMSIFTGNPVWDGIGSIGVGAILCTITFFLFWETKALLIGQSIDPIDRKELHKLLASSEEIEHTYDCMTLQMGEEAIVVIRARFTPSDSADELISKINAVEARINQQFPYFSVVNIEPDFNFED